MHSRVSMFVDLKTTLNDNHSHAWAYLTAVTIQAESLYCQSFIFVCEQCVTCEFTLTFLSNICMCQAFIHTSIRCPSHHQGPLHQSHQHHQVHKISGQIQVVLLILTYLCWKYMATPLFLWQSFQTPLGLN